MSLPKLNEETLRELVDWSKGLANTIEAQVPLVAQEILNRHIFMACMGCSFGIFLWIAALISIFLAYKTANNLEQKDEEFQSACVIIGFLLFIAGMIFILINLTSIYAYFMTPRLIVLEYIQRML